jgi:predicted outer membrane repeat protein
MVLLTRLVAVAASAAVAADGAAVKSWTALKNDMNKQSSYGVPAVVYTLAGDFNMGRTSQFGFVDLFGNVNVTLVGNGDVVLDAHNKDFFFDVEAGSNLVVKGVHFRNGQSYVGAINVNPGGSVTAANCTFSHGVATMGFGGAISSEGAVDVSHCTFNNGTATNGGGAIGMHGGFLSAAQCTFAENSALTKHGFGGAIYSLGGYAPSAAIEDCVFTGNAAAGKGGAVYCRDTIVRLARCTFSGGDTDGTGGAVDVEDGAAAAIAGCSFAANVARGSGGGGAIYAAAMSKVHIAGCTFAVPSASASAPASAAAAAAAAGAGAGAGPGPGPGAGASAGQSDIGRAVDAHLPAGAVTFDCPAGEAGPSANMSGPRLDASQLPPATAVVQCA